MDNAKKKIPSFDKTLKAYIDFYQTITQDNMHRLDDIVASDVFFKDSFNEAQGIEAYKSVLKKMFDDTDEPKFTILDYGFGQDNKAYLHWDFYFFPKGNKKEKWHFRGVSYLEFDMSGKIINHIDYWDSGNQLYQKLPVIGWFIKIIRKKFSIQK